MSNETQWFICVTLFIIMVADIVTAVSVFMWVAGYVH
jgi:hypothetical protein